MDCRTGSAPRRVPGGPGDRWWYGLFSPGIGKRWETRQDLLIRKTVRDASRLLDGRADIARNRSPGQRRHFSRQCGKPGVDRISVYEVRPNVAASDYKRSPYSLTATASAASSHLLYASAISFTLVVWVKTNGS